MVSKDLTGMTFNFLTVLGKGEGKSKHKKYWRCRCVCGNITNVETSKLVSLHTLSCGCKKKGCQAEDLTGQSFGYFKVLSFAYIKSNRTYWSCECICGKHVIKQGKLLKNGHAISCGCQKGKNRIKDLTGKTFGKLTAIKLVTMHNGACWLCRCSCGNTTVVNIKSLVSGNTKSCGCINKNRGFSKAEKEVVDFIRSIYKGEVIENDRSTIAPKELDIYVPEKKFAVEYDGLFWHSEGGECFADYHLKKTSECMKRGIRLLHVYENEWRDKKDIVKSMIASALGIYIRKEYARNLKVKEVTDKKAVVDFFEANHIQGAVHKFSLCLGLFKAEELLQAVVFGKQHFGKNGDTELYRMATKRNCQVVGGFSKLMEHSPYDDVVSYVALRMFDGKGYLAGKWKIEHQAEPSFCLTDGINVYSRHLFKKSRCMQKFKNVSEDMTEKEMQLKNGLYRLWDCGTFKVHWKR